MSGRSAALAAVALLLAAPRAAAPASPAPTLDHLVWSVDGAVLGGILSESGEESLRLYDGTTGQAGETLRLARTTAHDGTRLPALERFEIGAGGNRVLLVAGGDLFVWRPADHQVRRLTRSTEAERDAALSPDGTHVAFVRAGEVWVLDLESDATRRLTDDGGLGEEETGAISDSTRQRLGIVGQPALHWSDDGRDLAILRELPERSAEPPTPAPVDDAARPLAEAEPPEDPPSVPPTRPVPSRLHLGVALIADDVGGEIPVGEEGEPVRARWRFGGGRTIAVERLTPSRDRVDLLLCRADRLVCRPLAAARHNPSYDIADSLRFLLDGFLWAEQQGGVRTLMRFDTLGRPRMRLLPEAWDFVSVLALDDERSTVTVLALAASGPDPGRRGVIEVSWRSGAVRTLAQGDEEALPAPRGAVWVHAWRNADGSRHRALVRSDGREIAPLPPASESEEGISIEEIP